MFAAFVCIALHFHRSAAAASSPGQQSSPWLIGCISPSYSSSLRFYAPKGAHDLDPVTCSVHCLDEGFQVAALSSETCSCGNQLHGLVVSECFNTSSKEGTKDVKGGRERQSALYLLPLGNEQEGTVVLYRTEGPFLHNMTVSTSPEKVKAGETFVVKVSGKLAGRPSQPTGILGLGGQDLSYVTVEFLGMTPKGQSSVHVKVLDDGFCTASSDWIFNSPGKYEIYVRVSNPLSTLSSSLHLSVSRSSPCSLMMSLLHGSLGVPSCIPSALSDSNSRTVEAAFQEDPEERAAEFCWCFTAKKKEGNMEGEQTVFVCKPDCLNSSVECTFETDRVHAVSVNSSSAYRWTQETTDVEVVCLVVSDLREPVSESQLTVSVNVKLLTTMKHLLVLNLTPTAENNHSYKNHRDLNRKEEDCNHGNVTCDHNASEYYICLHVGLHLLHISNHSSCRLHFHLPILDPVGKLVLNISSEATRNQNHLVLFGITANCSYSKGAETKVGLLFNHSRTVVTELRGENRATSQNRSVMVGVEGNRKVSPQDRLNPTCQPATSQSPVHSTDDRAVRISAAKQAYPTNTDINFLAVADVPDPVEFLWHFGDSRSARTTSRTITKRYHQPGSYDVVVVASHGQTSVTSAAFPLVVQRAVKLNRLVHQASVLQNQTVLMSCRVTVGTNLTFLWSFGDGTTRPGQSTEEHVFHSIGEFNIQVTVSNMVSSASLSSSIFVVDRPCRPPPVKNMGPLKLQVRRYEVVRLGVTYETEVDCDESGGLNYTWTLFDSAGRTFPLTLTDTHRQSLTLQSHLLLYDTYTAVARVQVIGSVVYSNYSVRFQVMPSPPVVFIQGGTNVFINRSSGTVTLDGQTSYDPDFPMNPLSYSWTCKPVSSIASSCFTQHIHTSSPVLKFPVGFLKDNFDQFQFTLTVHSGERSASSETFVTVTSNLSRRVSVSCPQCQGDHVNWDQSFSVSAMCEDIPAEHIQYSWSLYLVNASSKLVTEVPFCSTVDLRAFSSIMENPATSPQTPEISTPHIPVASASQSNHSIYASAASSFDEIASETKTKMQNVDLTESRTHSNESRNTSDKAGLSESGHSNRPPVLSDGSIIYSDHFDWSHITSELPVDPDSSAYWDFSFPVLESGSEGGRLDPDYDVLFSSAEEGDPGMSAGRPTGVDGEIFSLGDDSVFDPATHQDEGSNLVDPKPSLMIQELSLLDLPRHPVDRSLFESYTHTGNSSPSLVLRPFSLRPGSRYMLEVAAKSQNSILGRTQLFLQTNPVPKGMTCQVQPVRGMELHTHFSIFCTSGREDLLYEYSYSIGGRTHRTLYQGRDFQHYFSLPSGDPSDDYKVTIYTKISSSTSGSATKPCPVTVQVQPSFLRHNSASSSLHDPDLELSESGLRNLSALVQLGNSAEIRNYVSLLSIILNRLSLDTEANTQTQRHMRNVLICTVCELEQVSASENICILEDLLQVTNQVTLMSARRVTAHIQGISEQFSESRAPDYTNQTTLNSLISLLSYSLQAVTSCSFTHETPNSVNITQVQESDSHIGRKGALNACIHDSSAGPHTSQRRSTPTKQVVQLVTDILQTASDLMLKFILFHKTKEHTVSTGLITLYAASQNQTSMVISSDSTTFSMPGSLLDHHSRVTDRFQHRRCVLLVLTEVSRSPFTWANYPTQLSGPVVDLNLYKCSTRRKIPVRSVIQPIITELHHRQRKSSVSEYILLRSQVNYHSFSITQEHLQQAIQLTVMFTPPSTKAFPIMLLFRMFERPTPSMHHLQRVHRWESNTTRITLPPSYLNAPGVGYLALLNADFGKAPRSKHLSEQISYSLTADSSLCLSWDGQQGAWTHHGCRTQQADTSPSVNCSCHQLRPLTVKQQQIQSSHETVDLDPFLSASSDLTVLLVLMLCLCLYILGLVACKRADVLSEENQRIHHLSDNSPSDPHLYAVTVHTGLCSAARMSAKVYIVLYGEDGASQTRELQAPGCTLFRRNSEDTFILSAADSLGPVWGVHIWHDNSGPSPDWYLRQVEISEVSRGCVRRWLFVGQCWLAVNKGDGRVERELRVCTQGLGFAKMLGFKLSAYMADFHIWMSVYTCPCPNSFTHTQRLTVCLLLLLGYACVNTVIISQTDDQLLFESGFIDISAVSVTTGLLSVFAVLPGATVISLLFRLRGVKVMGPGVQHIKSKMTEKDCFEDALSANESNLSWSSIQQWDTCGKKYQDTDFQSVFAMFPENKDTDKEPVFQPNVARRKEGDVAFESSVGPAIQNLLLISKGTNVNQAAQGKELLTEGSRFDGTKKACLSVTRHEGQEEVLQEKDPPGKCSSDSEFGEGSHHQTAKPGQQRKRQFRPTSQWSHYLAWTLCLLCSLSCLVLSVMLGMRFSSSKALLWIHSLFFSLMSCIFLIQPAVIFTTALIVSWWYRKRSDFHSFSSLETLKMWSHNIQQEEQFASSASPQRRCSYLEKLLIARRRTRFLRLVRPPALAELRKIRGKKRRDTLIYKTLRNVLLCISMFLLMICITYGSSFSDHYHLNRAVRRHFMGRNHDDAFMSIQTHEDWWKWTQTSLLDLLYKSASSKTESYIVIGDPIMQKMEMSDTFQSQSILLPHAQISQVSMVTQPRLCGPLGCCSGPNATVGLGHTKSDAASKLKLLRSGGWLGGQTVALKVQFTLYSPTPNLFTGVTLLIEQSPTGVMLPSAKVQSVKVYHTPAVWDYVVMVCQLLFFLLSLLQLCLQVSNVSQQGLMGYLRKPCNLMEVSLLTVTKVYYIYHIYHSLIIMEVVELLQRHSYRGHVDVGLLATSEQSIRTLRGIMVFLLTMKCVTVLIVNRTLAVCATLFAHSLSSLLWPAISGLILLGALSCVGNLLHVQNSWAFSSFPRFFRTILCQHRGLGTGRGLLSGNQLFYYGVLYLTSPVVWTAVGIGVVSTLVRTAKRCQSRRKVFTIAEMAGYIRQRVSEFTGKYRETLTSNCEEGKTYYLEEFESLVDELLFRLNALSNSLHHTLPPKAHRYREDDSPAISSISEPPNMDAQDSVRSQMTMNDTTDIGKCSNLGKTTPSPHLFRSHVELNVLQILQQRSQIRHIHSSDIFDGSDAKLRDECCLSFPEAAPLKRLWTGDVLEKQADQWSKNNNWFIKTQAAHREVVVEVLVHEEPGE